MMTMYLDHAATTALRPESMAAVRDAWTAANGNASGAHAVAREAKNALEEAREHAAAMIGADTSRRGRVHERWNGIGQPGGDRCGTRPRTAFGDGVCHRAQGGARGG